MFRNKNNLILLLAIVILAIAIYISFGGKNISFQRPYYAVYLRTGDMYFGHLCRFPRLTLTNVYFLQQTQNKGKVGLSLQKFENSVFSPEDKIELNKYNVVWVTKLQPDSKVVQFIEGKLPSAHPSAPSTQVPTSSNPAQPSASPAK